MAPVVGNEPELAQGIVMSQHRHPRTLIISWHWPPTNRASAGVLGALFGCAPKGVFRVITRSFPEYSGSDRRPGPVDLDSRIPPTYVRWPFDDQSQPTLRAIPALLRTILAMIRHSHALQHAWGVERVLAVYPHRFSLLIGWWAARRLSVPLVLYMHDLFAEAMTSRNRLRRWFWRAVDHVCLRDAWLVLVPTEEFAAHYRRRSINRCWVLPHCAPNDQEPTGPLGATGSLPASAHFVGSAVRTTLVRRRTGPHNGPYPPAQKPIGPPTPTKMLHLLYSGQVYEPHADAARAFIDATNDCEGVRVTFQSHPSGCDGLMGKVGARWLPYAEARAALLQADVFVVLLGFDTPCPEEVKGCFPSKLIDYLCVGRPILAVVPKGCFVDRLISQAGCGVVVERLDRDSIHSAIQRLRDPRTRAEMARAARRLAAELAGDLWMDKLLERLRVGDWGLTIDDCRLSIADWRLGMADWKLGMAHR